MSRTWRQSSFAGRWLNGVPASAGLVSGRTVMEVPPGDAPRDGFVLVAHHASVRTLVELRRRGLAAVVAETGGALSNAAIVAREIGVPAVFGVRCATSLIAAGAEVTVDGTSGSVCVESGDD